MKHLTINLMMILWCTTAVNAAAQSCEDTISATAASPRFQVLPDTARVLDQRTGLTWQRCAMGYSIEDQGTDTILDDACIADESIADLASWQQALQYAESFNAASGGEGWRLPNFKELLSIVEFKCVAPAITKSVFPSTLSARFWSSSPSQRLTNAFAIHFETGREDDVGQELDAMVRLLVD